MRRQLIGIESGWIAMNWNGAACASNSDVRMSFSLFLSTRLAIIHANACRDVCVCVCMRPIQLIILLFYFGSGSNTNYYCVYWTLCGQFKSFARQTKAYAVAHTQTKGTKTKLQTEKFASHIKLFMPSVAFAEHDSLFLCIFGVFCVYMFLRQTPTRKQRENNNNTDDTRPTHPFLVLRQRFHINQSVEPH